jgi:hypothetical protein
MPLLHAACQIFVLALPDRPTGRELPGSWKSGPVGRRQKLSGLDSEQVRRRRHRASAREYDALCQDRFVSAR